MATVKGARRSSPAEKRIRRAGQAMAKAAATTKRSMTERLCKQCDPPAWVRTLDMENHRANYHRPGGYMYERRKELGKQRAAAEKAQQAAAKTVRQEPARPAQRPANRSKAGPSGPAATSKGKPMPEQGGTNGSTWTSPVARSNGTSTAGQGPAAITTTEAVVQLMWTWARQVPPSIPASKQDAAAAAEMWRQAADALRARARMEAEQNKLPPDCVEPLEQAAQLVSRIGDHHMELVKRVTTKYGEVARTLADPRTPDADYLKGGV